MTLKRVYIDDEAQPFAGCLTYNTTSSPILFLNEAYLKGWEEYKGWVTRKFIIRHEIMHYKQWTRNPHKFANTNLIRLFYHEVEASLGAISKYSFYRKAILLLPILLLAKRSCKGFYAIRRRNRNISE